MWSMWGGWCGVSNSKRPTRYEIRVEGTLDSRWSEWFEGMQITNRGGETILSGALRDQPALHGVLERLRDFGLCVTTVRRLPLNEGT
jgi:hypothetical protein